MNHIESIQIIRDNLFDSKDKIISQFPDWNPKKDARITLFSKLINVCNSTQLSFTFMHFHLTRVDWWKQIAKSEIPRKDSLMYANEFDMFTKMGFIQFTFSSIESAFRLFVKAIDQNACNNGTADFKNLYSWLLKRCVLQSNESLLDLLRLVRNTIHNNGVYFHKSGRNESVKYNGVDYNFTIEKPVDFMTWDFIFKLSEDVAKLVNAVVESNVITGLNQVNDPFAK